MVHVHPIYGTPIQHLQDLDAFQPKVTDNERIYTVNIGDGMELAMMCGFSSKKSDVLRVGFHAAKKSGAERSHMFSPIGMSRVSGDPYILFSGPTLTISKTSILSWYIGTADVNPDDSMEFLVRRMLDISGAKYLLIEGSSGGGFVSMRFAARFRNAVAVPKVPQTDLFRYEEGPLAHVMKLGWQGWSYERIIAECPHRFRIADVYSSRSWNRGNLIHYVQNSGDTTHVSAHLTPFLLETGSADPHVFSAVNGLCSVSRPFTGAGHVRVPAAYWNAENEFALKRLRRMRRPGTKAESVWSEPSEFRASPVNREIRNENLEAHLVGNTDWHTT